MRIFVTGGTGFVGKVLAEKLIGAGHEVTLLVRMGSEQKVHSSGIRFSYGDVLDLTTLKIGLRSQEAVIHLVGIIREFPHRGITFQRLHVQATRNVVDAATAQGIHRYLHMSALGSRPNAVSQYHQTKYQAEEIVRQSSLDYTIFRQSVIFGKEDGFVNLFAGMIQKIPLIPAIGGGKSKLQPIAVEDAAEGFVQALSHPNTIGKTYELGGPKDYTLSQLLDRIAHAMNRTMIKIPVPFWYMNALASLFEYFPWFPVSRDQLIMLKENNTCDPTPFAQTFGISLTPFEEGIRTYVTH